MGAPKGNKNGANGTLWKDAVLRALGRASPEGVGASLDRIASRLVASAIDGDRDARNEIACRLDGKPTEHIAAVVEHVDESRVADIREELSKASSERRVQ